MDKEKLSIACNTVSFTGQRSCLIWTSSGVLYTGLFGDLDHFLIITIMNEVKSSEFKASYRLAPVRQVKHTCGSICFIKDIYQAIWWYATDSHLDKHYRSAGRRTATVLLFETSSEQVRSNEDREGSEYSYYYIIGRSISLVVTLLNQESAQLNEVKEREYMIM